MIENEKLKLLYIRSLLKYPDIFLWSMSTHPSSSRWHSENNGRNTIINRQPILQDPHFQRSKLNNLSFICIADADRGRIGILVYWCHFAVGEFVRFVQALEADDLEIGSRNTRFVFKLARIEVYEWVDKS